MSKISSRPAGRLTGVVGRIKKDLADPLFRNAYALLINALCTSLLGLVYWILAARFYSPTLVGASSALIATLLLASTVAQLNLGGALARFLPRAGWASRRLVLSAYAVCGALAIVVALGAMPWISRMAHTVGLGGPGGRLWLVAAVVVWCIFALQDHTLTGLREAIWVPAENALFGLLKILLLTTLAATLPRLGILASWTIPMALMLLPVNMLIFGRFLPRHMHQGIVAESLGAKKIGHFVALDYAGSLFNLASSQLLPVLVAARIGAEANGYFYIAWVVMTTLDLALVSVTSSLTVEGAHEQARLPELTSALFHRLLVGGALLVAGIVIGAPYVLSIFGSEYASNASGLLRLLAVGLLPRAAIVLWMSTARVQNKMGEIVAVQGALSVIVLGLSALLMSPFNIAGVGIAYLIGQTALALALSPRLRRLMAPFNRAKAMQTEAAGNQWSTEPEVSMDDLAVVIPVRNAEALIEDCLASVVRCKPAEIIVVDGLSTDSTLDIAGRFPVRIISDGGFGLPVARTLGAQAAKSRWVALVDADLVVNEADLEQLLREFVTGGYVGLQAGLRSVSGKGYWSRALANHHRYGFSRTWFGLGMTVFEREQLLQLGFDRDFFSGEDIELRLRLKDLGARTGVSRKTVAVHRFQDGFMFARRQWVADGTGLARVIRKRGFRAWWLVGVPLASGVWGMIVSLIRLQPQWIPYFLCYLVANYASMMKQLCRPAKGSSVAAEAHAPFPVPLDTHSQ
ncbi:MAG TPA: glycosyltransferase [Actinomycetota bacterium]|nr:glycosyltransferase [Actinomycetota bacterium]